MTPMIPAYSPVLNSTLFELYAESAKDLYFFVWDLKTDYAHWSAAALKEFELPDAYFGDVVQVMAQLIHPDERNAMHAAWLALLNGEGGSSCNLDFRMQDRSGCFRRMRCNGRLPRDTQMKPALFAGFLRDLGTDIRYDRVTGLQNMQELAVHLRNTLSIAGSSGGVLLFGIDDFRNVAEDHNAAYANQALRTLADRLLALDVPGQLFRVEDAVFAYWQPGATPTDLEAVFARFRITAGSLTVRETPLPLQITGSYVLYPNHGSSVEALMTRAVRALKHNRKYHPGGLYGFTDAMYRAEEHDRRLRAALRHDVENNCANFSLDFQPQIYPKRGSASAAEALLRWHNPEFPDIGPAEFIPILEDSGDILIVGQWAMRTALEQVRLWQSKVPGIGVSLNVSGRQMSQRGFAEWVCNLLSRYGLSGDSLCLELTPSCRDVPGPVLLNAMKTMQASGISLALDNFGVGADSLQMLRQLPLQWIKPDRSLVKNLPDDPARQAILSGIIEIAHRMKVHVTVVGVENEAQQRFAIIAGADFLQGYQLARPMPAQEFYSKVVLPQSSG